MTGLATPEAPWLAAQLASLLERRAHALLLQGPSGLGQYSLAIALAQAWLCEQPSPGGACGVCGSCHLVDARGHPDLTVLMPETVMLDSGWPLDEKAADEIDSKKRKASREIRVESMRETVEFSQRTAARGRGTVVMVYPAERMNAVTANALLKTLEEPPGHTRFILASEAAHLLLPTIRSRCQVHAMAWPQPEDALAWLASRAEDVPALADKDTTARLLRVAGGRPEDALELAAGGASVAQWALLPAAVARGDATALASFAPAEAVSVLQKLCHDLWLIRLGAAPRFFRQDDLPKPPSIEALARWSRALQTSARTADHPFKADLMLEDLASQARQAMQGAVHLQP